MTGRKKKSNFRKIWYSPPLKKKRKRKKWLSSKTRHRLLYSSKVKITAADSKAKGKKPAVWQLSGNWSFRLNYSIHRHTGIGCDICA